MQKGCFVDSKKIKKEKEVSSIKQNEFTKATSSNPIEGARILPINTKTSSNRLYGGYFANSFIKQQETDYSELISAINSAFIGQTDPFELFCSIHNNICNKFNLNFSAIGLYNNNSINIKLIDKTAAMYNSKILLNERESIVIKAFEDKHPIHTQDSNYLKLNYLSSAPTVVIPMMTNDECLGVIIFSDNNNNQHIELYKLIANCYAMFYKNKVLSELVDRNTDKDSLTGLSNYKKFQEDLTQEIAESQNHEKELALCIIDIANISEINSELGHARGDAIIREVAKKVQKNVRNTDILGRYGGDEIAIIMPETSVSEAKYVCEFLLYNLSCTMFDDLGQLKFSCGISMFPEDSNKQEKLNTLAQQALYVAKSRRLQSGLSEIVATGDYNFWDDEAVKGFAYVLSKQHATTAINLEEELINQFHNEAILSSDHMVEVVSSLAAAIDAKDTYTKGHSASVSRYSEALARAINLPNNEVERIKLGAMLHDVGKIGIPEQILRKPTKLSDDEWQIMKQHPAIGADKVLKPNKSLHDLIPMVKYHHEHIDGSGYPYGLKGDEIPQSARIVAIADAFHALVSDRPYRKGLSVTKACEILKMGAGVQWDKDLIRQFIIIAPSLATNV